MKTHPNWIKSADASVAELSEQLSCAKKAHADAEAAVDAALADFDAKPNSSTESALAQAREEAQSVREFVGRAERLLAAAVERDKAQEIAGMQAEVSKINAELNGPMRARTAELEQLEADAIAAVLDARLERLRHNEAMSSVRTRGEILEMRLGTRDRRSLPESSEPSKIPIEKLIDTKLVGVEHNDPRRRWRTNLMNGR